MSNVPNKTKNIRVANAGGSPKGKLRRSDVIDISFDSFLVAANVVASYAVRIWFPDMPAEVQGSVVIIGFFGMKMLYKWLTDTRPVSDWGQ
jgi:hypothetical protein